MVDGYKYLTKVFSESAIFNVRDFLINSYKDEHSSFVESGLLAQYYSVCNPYPVGDVLDMVLQAISSVGVLDAPTVYGSLSLHARLSEKIINLFVGNALLIHELNEIFGFSGEYFMHLAPAVRVIYPNNKVASVPVHIDSAYNSHLTKVSYAYSNDRISQPPFVTLWVPIQGTLSTHGGLKLFPGVFLYESSLNNHSERLWIPPLDVDEEDALLIDYEIGDCVVFHPNLVHGSHVPQSPISFGNSLVWNDSFRVSIDVRVFPASTKSSKHHISLSSGEVFVP